MQCVARFATGERHGPAARVFMPSDAMRCGGINRMESTCLGTRACMLSKAQMARFLPYTVTATFARFDLISGHATWPCRLEGSEMTTRTETSTGALRPRSVRRSPAAPQIRATAPPEYPGPDLRSRG